MTARAVNGRKVPLKSIKPKALENQTLKPSENVSTSRLQPELKKFATVPPRFTATLAVHARAFWQERSLDKSGVFGTRANKTKPLRPLCMFRLDSLA